MRHTKAQRSIVYAAALGGLTEEQCNEILASAKFPPVNHNSWLMVNRSYIPRFKSNLSLMGECIQKPKSIADLPDFDDPPAAVSESPSSPSVSGSEEVPMKKSIWSRLFGT